MGGVSQKAKQLTLALRRPGPAPGHGRKPRPDREGFVRHVTRPMHAASNPVHVTVRAVRLAPSFRTQQVLRTLERLFARASEKGFRLFHYSVQGNHLHLLVEATDRVALARGMQRLLSRAAFAINALAGRAGKLWRDRYHRHDLTTPRAVRNAYVYVLNNWRKHERASAPGAIDAFSSAIWFSLEGGFAGPGPRAGPPPTFADLRAEGLSLADAHALAAPIAPARSWLARVGWRRHGLLRLEEAPRARG